ncbi:MAG: BamA/TamA family outer membrane protein [Proteobacteria bacterium]|nr:BamA/TamA family outer membrane protein [Pseudomonadota bacterium]
MAGQELARGAILLLAAALLLTAQARALDPTYEDRRLARLLHDEGFERHPRPEGKLIAFVRVFTRDVLTTDEPWPTFLNALHWITRESMVRRELLFAVGGRFRDARSEETMRNLRGLGIFSFVRIVAVRTASDTQVGVVVLTRDLWSLRLEQEFSGAGTRFNQLFLQAIERNLLGRNKRFAANFRLMPISYRIGQRYFDYRVWGGTLLLSQRAGLRFHRHSHAFEGGSVELSLLKPYYNLAQRFSCRLDVSAYRLIQRNIDSHGVRTWDDPATAAMEAIPVAYDDEGLEIGAAAGLRRGDRFKQSVSLGVGLSDRNVGFLPEPKLDQRQARAFAGRFFPRVRRQVFPSLGYSLWLTRFATLRNLGTFGRSENVRTGPSVQARLSLPLRHFGSSTSSMVVRGFLGWIGASDEALLELALAGSARLEDGRAINQLLDLSVRGATPPWFFGRLVARARVEARRHDTNNTWVTLGAENGLRGYGLRAFYGVGKSRMRFNLEYRTDPLVLLTVHAGFALFYDAGSLYSTLRNARMRHAAGLGLRLLFPQLNAYVFRFDLGLPLDRPGIGLLVSFGSSQMITLTAAEDASAAP